MLCVEQSSRSPGPMCLRGKYLYFPWSLGILMRWARHLSRSRTRPGDSGNKGVARTQSPRGVIRGPIETDSHEAPPPLRPCLRAELYAAPLKRSLAGGDGLLSVSPRGVIRGPIETRVARSPDNAPRSCLRVELYAAPLKRPDGLNNVHGLKSPR
jgi:hypothetical protein